MTIFQEAYPSNPKAMFFLGLPSFMEPIFNVMMSFSKEKFRQRIQMCTRGDFSKLHEELGTEVLPKEYGGTNGCMQDHIGKQMVLILQVIVVSAGAARRRFVYNAVFGYRTGTTRHSTA